MNLFDKEVLRFVSENPDHISEIDVTYQKSAIPLLIDTPMWPRAVNQHVIIKPDNVEKQTKRARSILRSLSDVNGKSFLDFGCGNDLCAKAAIERGSRFAIGYDVNKVEGISDDWVGVVEAGPYDVVLMYDVIDHMVGPDGNLVDVDGITKTMIEIKRSMFKDSVMHVRCHPWTSRHGTHCYLKKNKAYIHYITDEFDGIPTIKITAPVSTYEKIFTSAGFKIAKKSIVEQSVEPIFISGTFSDLANHFSSKNRWMYKKILSFTFIDFELRC